MLENVANLIAAKAAAKGLEFVFDVGPRRADDAGGRPAAPRARS